MTSDAYKKKRQMRRERERSLRGRERCRIDRRLLWRKLLTLLLLDLQRTSTLNGVGHSPADIADAGIAKHYRLY
jgi:hypothetical protein